MKITHVISQLVPGGAERVVVELANAAAIAGNDVSLVISFPIEHSVVAHTIHEKIKIYYVAANNSSVLNSYICSLRFIYANSWLYEQDIIHVHLLFGSVFGFLVKIWQNCRLKKGPAIVSTNHSVGMPQSKWRLSLTKWLALRINALALMAEDTYWRKFIAEHPNYTSAIIPNGITVEEGKAVADSELLKYRSSLGIPSDCEHIVGTIGMLRPDRKPELTIQVFSEIIKATGYKTHCILFGSGSEFAKVSQIIKDLHLETNIHLPGLVKDTRLSLALMNVYVSLNVGAITGMAAMEAACRGVPVVGIQLSNDYRAHDTDWIWSSSDLSAVAMRVVTLLANPLQQKTVSQQQHDYFDKNLTSIRMYEKYSLLYHKVIQNAV